MILKCVCCGIEREFEDGEESFREGWDAPPYFSQFICCDLCPASWVVMGLSHEHIHRQWAEKGRPKEFGPDCV